jgi:predicted cobalt transporter CbtA
MLRRKRTLLLSGIALSFLFAVSCGPSLLHIQDRAVTEAEILKSEVAAADIQDESIAAADGYLALARGSSSLIAVHYADLSAAIYTTALARQSHEASVAAVDEAKEALLKSEEQVKKYQQIMNSISAAGKEAK